MHMTLLDFYKQVLASISIGVDDNGYCYFQTDSAKTHIVLDGGKNLVLPTENNIKNIYVKDNNGNPVSTKVLYNPLNEDVIKGDSLSLIRTKHSIERIYGLHFHLVGTVLLELASNPKLQEQTVTVLNKFLSGLTQLGLNAKVKDLVDDMTKDIWIKLYKKYSGHAVGLFQVHLKKKGKKHGESYNRLAVLTSEVYDALIEADENKEDKVCGIKVRRKDVKVCKFLFEYILGNVDEELHTVSLGSNDSESPTFIALYSLYLKLTARTNKIIKALKFMAEDVYDSVYVKDLMDVEVLHDLEKFKSELQDIPSDIDINRQGTELANQQAQPQQAVAPQVQQAVQQAVQPVQPQPVQQGYPTQPVPVNTYQPEEGGHNALLEALAKNGMNPSNPLTAIPTMPIAYAQQSPLRQGANMLPAIEQVQQQNAQQQAWANYFMQQQQMPQMPPQNFPPQQMGYPPQGAMAYPQQPPMGYQQPYPPQQNFYPQQGYGQAPGGFYGQPQMTGTPMVPKKGTSFGQPNVSNPGSYYNRNYR